MSVIQGFAIWIAIAAIVVAVFAAAAGVYIILFKPDDWYQAQHRRYLERRNRVQGELDRKRHA